MRTYHLVFDGSYNLGNDRLGLGFVHYDEGEIIDRQSIPVDGKEIQEKKSLVAEGLAACAALNYAEAGSEIYIYGDNADIIRLLKGGFPHAKETQINELVQEHVGRHTKVFAHHIIETNKSLIPEEIFAMAHNASAEASGSKKRESTGELKGQYTASVTNLGQAHNGMQIIGKDSKYPSWDPRHPDFKL